MKNKLITILLLIGLVASILGILEGSPSFASKTSEHYRVGYDDACAGRIVPGHHTTDYENGYAAGQAACVNQQGSQQGQGGQQGIICNNVVNCNPTQQQAQAQQQNGG